MASTVLRISVNTSLLFNLRGRYGLFRTKWSRIETRLSDNRGICNDVTQESDGDKHKNKVKVRNHMKIMQEKMRDLHNLPNVNQMDHPPTPQHIPIQNSDPDTNYYCDDIHSETLDRADQDRDILDKVDTGFIEQKFKFLQTSHSNRMERVIETPFGFVRLDDSALDQPQQKSIKTPEPKSEISVVSEKHLQLSPPDTNSKIFKSHHKSGLHPENFPQSETSADEQLLDQNLFDEQYFGSIAEEITLVKEPGKEVKTEFSAMHKIDGNNIQAKRLPKVSLEKESFVDEQYFGNITLDPHLSEDVQDAKPIKTTSSHEQKDAGSAIENNIFDDQYFGSVNNNMNKDTVTKYEKLGSKTVPNIPFVEDLQEDEDFERYNQYSQKKIAPQQNQQTIGDKDAVDNLTEPKQKEDINVGSQTKQEIRQAKRRKVNYDKPETPYDMAMKIRHENKAKKATDVLDPKRSKWNGQVDSRGFRILTDQVLDIHNIPSSVVVKILKDSILYEDDGLLAIDKPYGLPSHGGPGVHISIGQLLDPLASSISPTSSSNKQLFMVHRLDKETTGIMLLAKNQQSQHNLHHMFVKQKILKKYWMLTKGIPYPAEGVIEIPMAEGTVGDKFRMTLRPKYSAEARHMQRISKAGPSLHAVTNYKVLDSNHHVALVQCQPESGLKHQIRCHMSFALNTPVLGDHKYSHFSKLAPQKLHPETLQRLGIRQAKVRHLAMHLHAKQLVLPEYLDGRNLFINSSLPKHFVQNMKWLKITPPKD